MTSSQAAHRAPTVLTINIQGHTGLGVLDTTEIEESRWKQAAFPSSHISMLNSLSFLEKEGNSPLPVSIDGRSFPWLPSPYETSLALVLAPFEKCEPYAAQGDTSH